MRLTSASNVVQFAMMIVVLIVAGIAPASAGRHQYNILYAFCSKPDCVDGSNPSGGLLQDSTGNLYGTTNGGGAYGFGTVYELSPSSGGWKYSVLHSFCATSHGDCAEGFQPRASLIMDVNGNLYGTTASGDTGYSWGTVFELIPNARRTKWTLQVLYKFCSQPGCLDGSFPFAGLAYHGQAQGQPYDGTSPLFSTTSEGGSNNGGTVFELTTQDGSWTETVLHSFCSETDCADGEAPLAGLAFDNRNRIVGLVPQGGTSSQNAGLAFRLTGPDYKEDVLYDFCSAPSCTDGLQPYGAPVLDDKANIYGTTGGGGNCPDQFPCGVLFRLDRHGAETVLHSFCSEPSCTDGVSPNPGPIMTSSGVLYGTALSGGAGQGGGVVYQFHHSFRVLHSFCVKSGCLDGYSPDTPLIVGQDGALYGTAGAGRNGAGVIYRLFP